MVEPVPLKPAASVPEHVAILGLGPSVTQWLELTKRHGGRYADEVWSINALGDVFRCDRVFHMDDVRIQEIRAGARPDSNIARMLGWLKRHPGPIYTSRRHSDYPGLVDFPLRDVVNAFGQAYFNSTAAYAVAFAVYIGVKKISCYGFDFTYPNAHHAEKGRACVEFWLGVAVSRGIEVRVPHVSSLMDACERRLYGYDTLDVTFDRTPAGGIDVRFAERAEMPTADEIEAMYDHSAHPSPLVRAEEERAAA
ncbi:MAG TPA: hypothetical protein DCZ11_00275 [Gammaproteobacteria bacterium]|nr:hypothetical protein [Gammaproteobacteria bacterium]MCH76862.1 hypothetical protein [Gammaproteobacteria bacterium]